MKVLLGVTFALLLAALGFAYTQGGRGNNPVLLGRIDQLEAEVHELETNIARMEGKIELLAGGRTPAAVPRRPAPRSAVPDMPGENDNAAARLRRQEAAKGPVKPAAGDPGEADVDQQEPEDELAGEDQLLRRQRLEEKRPELAEKRRLRESDAIAEINEWNQDYAVAGLRLIGQPGLKKGDVLSVRRQGRIVGQLKVIEISIDGVTAELFPKFRPGMVVPEFRAGDEVIFPPAG